MELSSNEMVFLRPRPVPPDALGPTMEEVYLMISVSGGKRTPSSEEGSLMNVCFLHEANVSKEGRQDRKDKAENGRD